MDFFTKNKKKTSEKIIGTWKILVADDEEDVHSLTKMVLENFRYQNKSLEIISAYSGAETLNILKEQNDIILVLLDVVMESDDAGLMVVKKLREELHNNLTQVILRTGQAGKAPELDVVSNYAINDYKEKTELTSQKLFTSIITAIRSYENTKSLESNKYEIEKLNFDLKNMVNSFDKRVLASKVDEKGNIIYASDAFCKIIGYTQEELIGTNFSMLRHPDSDKKTLEKLEISYKAKKPWSGELIYLTKEKEALWVKASRFPEFDKSNNFLHFMNTYEDITDKKEVENLNHEMNRLISTFDENVIASKTDITGKLTYVSHAFCTISGYTQKELLNKNHSLLRDQDTTNEFYDELWSTITAKKVWKGEIKDKKKDGTKYWLQTTITPEYDVHGKFICYTSISEDISNKKHIEKANRKIEILNTEIEDTQKEVVFKMGAIGEARSKETGMHVRRVAEYSKLFALYLDIPPQKAEILKQASPMHDIGKVAIPDSILNKPGKHTAQEWEIMKTHSQLGYEMLGSSNKNILKIAAIVAREHHEKWDGTGYPRGLAGKDIHIYGRITAMADVFDALGSERVYKKAWEDERIFEFFKDQREKHFDPEIVDIFFKHLDKFLVIRDKYKDS